MKIFVNTTFTGFYPVGTAAVVVAENKEQAAEILSASLKELHLEPVTAEDMIQISTKNPGAFILCDGNY
jgi:hypothetical protein